MSKLRLAVLSGLCLWGLALLLLSWPARSAQAEPNPAPAAQPPTEVTLSNGFRLSFLGVTYNPDGTSTWRYEVEELPSAKDLSNWVLALPDCVTIVDADPEPWEAVHPDPNAQLYGIKWETGDGFQQGEFSVTVAGQWAVGVTDVAAKGPDVAYGLLAGPICDEAAALALTKTVDPLLAQPGDVLTYSVVLSNTTTSLAGDLVLSDTIPAGTTYVNDSLSVSSGVGQYQAAENQIVWEGDLDPGQGVTVTFNVYVQEGVAAGSTIENTAYAAGQVATASTAIEAVQESAWTLLVYLSADNNLDNPQYSLIRDREAFNALERAAFQNPRLQIYVQWDRSPNHAGAAPDDHTRRYRVRPDLNPFALANYTEGVDTWDLGEVNMGDPQALYEFITWARGRYSSPHDALSIIAHGGGWSPTFEPALGSTAFLPSGIAWDDSSGDYLSTAELGEALYWGTEEQADPFDVLFLEASMMAMLENAYEVRDSATYLVASESAVWARFAYDAYLSGVDDSTSPLDFAEQIVTGYAASLTGHPLTMGAIAIDLAALEPLVTAVDDLALTLTDNLSDTRPLVAQAYSATQKFDSNWDLELTVPDAYVDLYDFAVQLQATIPGSGSLLLPGTAIQQSAQGVLDAWGQAVVLETHRSGQPWLDPSVSWDFDGAHGLSIYLPLGEDLWLRDYYRASELDLAQDTNWDEFIHQGWYAGQSPPPLPDTRQGRGTAAGPIDPAQRPGLLTPERDLLYLPLIRR